MDTITPRQSGFERSLSNIVRADSIRAENERDDHRGEMDRLQAAAAACMDEIRAAFNKLQAAGFCSDRDVRLAMDSANDSVSDAVFDARSRIEERIEACEAVIEKADAP